MEWMSTAICNPLLPVEKNKQFGGGGWSANYTNFIWCEITILAFYLRLTRLYICHFHPSQWQNRESDNLDENINFPLGLGTGWRPLWLHSCALTSADCTPCVHNCNPDCPLIIFIWVISLWTAPRFQRTAGAREILVFGINKVPLYDPMIHMLLARQASQRSVHPTNLLYQMITGTT